MERRNFFKYLSMNAIAAAFAPSVLASQAKDKSGQLTVKGVNTYLRSLYDVGEDSVDRIIIGSPDTRVTKIGTCWMPYWDTLKKAVASGVNLMIAHEPTFYTHFDLNHIEKDFGEFPMPAREKYLQQAMEKKKWIEEKGLSIIRSHDVPDILSKIGIPFAFGMALGYSNEDIICSKPYYNVYRIRPVEAGKAARDIASRLLEFGQAGVAFYGDEKRMVSSVGLGTGAICDPIKFMDLEADLRIAIDDSVRTWTQTYYAMDSGDPLIIVNHGTAEENGMRLLHAHLQEVFSLHEVIHFNQGCGYKWIS